MNLPTIIELIENTVVNNKVGERLYQFNEYKNFKVRSHQFKPERRRLSYFGKLYRLNKRC